MARTPFEKDPPAIQVRGLRKSFGDTAVLQGLDLDVAEGEVVALLGPNGAGKTTTVEILTTLQRADGGTARIFGHDVVTEAAPVRHAIGVTGQFSAVDGLLSAEENLRLIGDLLHLDPAERDGRVAELLARFDLVDAADRPSMTYSGGMKRRLDLAMSLLGDPRLLFLDEPTTGLDPRSRRVVWDTIRDLAGSGVTVFLTTQYLEEADQLADRVVLLDRGVLVADGSPAELKARVPGGHLELRFADLAQLEAAAAALDGSSRDDADLALHVPSDGGVRSLRAVFERLDAVAVEVDDLSIHAPSLDDVFLALTDHQLQEATR